MLSDFLYIAPHDQMSKLLVAVNVPVYMYVLNTTVTSIPLPEWRMYSHDTEYYFLTGAPFMDNGNFFIFIKFNSCNVFLINCIFRIFLSYTNFG